MVRTSLLQSLAGIAERAAKEAELASGVELRELRAVGYGPDISPQTAARLEAFVATGLDESVLEAVFERGMSRAITPSVKRALRDAPIRETALVGGSRGVATDFRIPRITSETGDEHRGTFVIEPLDRGFGYTFGNSLRRVLLSSLAGAAVTSIRIEGMAHEFSTIPGVEEDVTDIVLNLKGIVCRMHSDATEIEAALVATGPGEITAADIDLPSGVEILNPDVHIASLDKKARLEFYLTIGRGRGYRAAEDNKSADQPIGVIPIDSIFSPVRRVAYSVEQARVGQRTDFDKLTLDIETDGSVEPSAALREAAELLISQAAIFTDEDRVRELLAGPAGQREGGITSVRAGADAELVMLGEEWGILIEELELGVRSYNCLKRAGIQTVGDLISKSEAELNAIPNFSKKSIDEVIETLEARGLHLREIDRAGRPQVADDRPADVTELK
jgi:DNA-directed RNA polymerase subunit alpha